MSRSTISTFQLFEMFPTAESARLFLESRIWSEGVTCPSCKAKENITTRKGGFYRCNPCQLDFTIRTGTIFERSHKGKATETAKKKEGEAWLTTSPLLRK
jgi:transposase-like protein